MLEDKNFIAKDKIQKEFDEYRKFAYGKNLFAVAMTLILASSMQKFVSTISETVFMPIINYFISSTNGNWRLLIFSPVKGLDVEIGKFAAGFLEFTIVTICLYLIYSKIIKKITPEIDLEKK
jgi:large-conductance mechanosensitive channel